jgi:hypothetical protein
VLKSLSCSDSSFRSDFDKMSEGNGGLLLFGGFEVDITQFDLSDHSSRVPSIKITNIVFIGLITLIVGLRIVTRALFVRKIFADDSKCELYDTNRGGLTTR